MISLKKLIKLARKSQKLVAIRRKRLTLPGATGTANTSDCSTSATVEKGHFVVYSVDQKRFLLPLGYLKNEILKELLKEAEEEFGLPRNGPLTLPCDVTIVEYVIALIKQHVTRDVEKAFSMSIASSCRPSSLDLHHQIAGPQMPICSF